MGVIIGIDPSLVSHFSEIQADVQLIQTVLVGEGEKEGGGGVGGRGRCISHIRFIVLHPVKHY